MSLAGKRVAILAENNYQEYVDQEVVQDGNIITSRVPTDLPAFCRTIITALES